MTNNKQGHNNNNNDNNNINNNNKNNHNHNNNFLGLWLNWNSSSFLYCYMFYKVYDKPCYISNISSQTLILTTLINPVQSILIINGTLPKDQEIISFLALSLIIYPRISAFFTRCLTLWFRYFLATLSTLILVHANICLVRI